MTERPNKSQRKREMNELLKLAERMIELDPDTLRGLDLGEDILAAAEHARSLHQRGARLRQLRFLRGLLDGEDLDELVRVLDGADRQGQAESEAHHRIERWRDRLMAEDSAIWDDLRRELGELDVQHLRGLIRNSKREVREGKPPRASRMIFKYLRELAELSPQEED